ncbi:metal ABC transporter ATP-binding protein [Lederbergia citrea]|uniref:Metal ABC transporter ATP-binding protein n=1 Tax=Lederbergia citrea TaxID=2833581 RepID=A0A942UR77_9BACI|nr:metal ABC transporter ATP-binding protein [Lederbergia citrea]MBS4223556.1 metal ABC transporter ATP-binding protein [Lederbergia citrea]
MANAVKVKNLQVSYYGQEAVQNVSFEIETGKLVGIIGPNGAGKSTLLKALLGLIPIDKGQVNILGKEIQDIRKKIAYVPQRNNIDWDFPISVLETVLLGTYPNMGVFRKPKRMEKELSYECLKKVGMESFKDRQIGELSGGQQQRVFLARAMAQQTDILFLDEPFVGIDVSSEETIIQILKELRNEGKTVLLVHHDLSKSNEYFDELILLNKELIGCGPVSEVLKPGVIAKAYGGHLSFLREMVVVSP